MLDTNPKSELADAKIDTGGGLSFRERRAFPRYTFIADARLTETGSGAQIEVRTSEVSLGGCYVETLNPLPGGTLIRFRLQNKEAVFETRARIVYAHPGIGMGIAFEGIEPDQRRLLENWIAELQRFFLEPL
jgi:hypothetical protein